MPVIKDISSNRKIMGKIEYGTDLLEEIVNICKEKNIKLGKVQAIGAVQNATVAFYNQEQKVYEITKLDQPMEIVSLMGNVSIKEGEPMAHVHVSFSDQRCNMHGGHLSPGTKVFICEYIIEEFDCEEEFLRGFDETTGLPLWEFE